VHASSAPSWALLSRDKLPNAFGYLPKNPLLLSKKMQRFRS
jgi:hypothetical protein